VPFDPGSVVYVWFYVLINSAAAVGYGWNDELCRQWWPANLHVIGKDITRFHCVIWPAMLMSAELALPAQVFGHGWISVNNQRMSKSLGNVVDPVDAADRFGTDPLRLYLVKEVPYGGDGDFSWDRLGEKYNADLANNLGNLVSRVSAMTERYRSGRLTGGSSGSDRLPGVAAQALTDYRSAMDRYALHEGVAATFRLVDAANLFIADTQPWALAKDDANADRLTGVLADAAEAVRVAAMLLLPVMPSSAAEIVRRMGELRAANELRLTDAAWRNGEKQILNQGPMWPRRDLGASIVTAPDAPDAPHASDAPGLTQAAAPAPADDRISIEDFMKVDLRVAKIVEAERVPKSKKLVKMSIDVGTDRRTIVAGIAEAYEPEALVGKTVVIVANLKPAKLMGIESNGMVLAASPDGGMPIVVNAEPATPGTRVR
jgi:methionyl-tRNA synthetase